MPPRLAPGGSQRGGRGGGGGGGGGGRGGGGGGRGGSGGGGRGRGGPVIASRGGRGGGPSAPVVASHVETVGVRRSNYGTAGRPYEVVTNHFAVSIPTTTISHYDVISGGSEKTQPARLNMDLMKRLQESVAPELFTPRAAYDGRKNLFAPRTIPFTDAAGNPSNSAEFEVSLANPLNPPREGSKGPKVYKIRLKKVAEVNPTVLQRFLEGQQSHDNDVLTAITALNVVVRMEPMLNYPFNIRSFFTDKEKSDIGGGLVLWRGYFQSVRPAINQMLINIDISTGTMYKGGPLLDLCLDFLTPDRQPRPQAQALAPKRGFPDRQRLKLQRFISGMRIRSLTNEGKYGTIPRVIKKLSSAGAADLRFEIRKGENMSVAEFFRKTYNKPLQYPDLPCVEVGSGALLPLEVCIVDPGQIMRKQVPPEKTQKVLEFATMRPAERLQSIKNGLAILKYNDSPYVSQFGMQVEPTEISIQSRILQPPTLKYGRGSSSQSVTPKDGKWNMADKRFFQAATIGQWMLIIYEQQNRFRQNDAQELIENLGRACTNVGIQMTGAPGVVRWENSQGRVIQQLQAAGQEFRQKTNALPTFIVVVLPEYGNDVYQAVKHFGDCIVGVATQCLKSSKCRRANDQYWANVCLKINVKLGGINTIPDQGVATSALTDSTNPTIVMGADVVHPAPGSEGRPSFTSLVANVDSNVAKYIATSRVQTSRQEMIDDLEAMSKHMISKYMAYRQHVEKAAQPRPKRIIFYRDGVSEGQFKQVLEIELPALKRACESLGVTPSITIIVVGKRHHVRFFPKTAQGGDRSGNCFPGMVVDHTITHPTELDFYLQSHAGILGTSRPAHYNVLYDETNFTPDNLQQLSYALCHVYARSTRSVSIPAPVYYADIVCARAKNHYDPSGNVDLSESATQTENSSQALHSLEAFRQGFRPLHANQEKLMYFS